MRDDECFFCGEDGALDQHHIVPKRHGGSDKDDNLVTLCPTCHAKIERELYNRDFYEKISDSLMDDWEPTGEIDYWSWVEEFKRYPGKFNEWMSGALKESDLMALGSKHFEPHFRYTAEKYARVFNEENPKSKDIRKSELVKIFQLSNRYEVVKVEKDDDGYIESSILRFDYDDLHWALKETLKQERKSDHLGSA